jgi:predicted RNase H-like HicB family nuclease
VPKKYEPPPPAQRAWNVRVEVEPWPEGGYIASAPDLQGCWVVGDTVPEVVHDIYEGIEMAIASRLKHGDPIPSSLEELGSETKTKLILQLPVGL